MSIEENKVIVRRFFDAINAKDLDTLDEILAPDVAQLFKEKVIPWLYSTFAEHHAEITDMIAEGNQVVARLATSGLHTGEWMGISPTGEKWTNIGVYFIHIVDGKIVKTSDLFDKINHFTQLGGTLVPPPSA